MVVDIKEVNLSFALKTFLAEKIVAARGAQPKPTLSQKRISASA